MPRHARGHHDVVERDVALHQQVVDREVHLVRVEPQPDRERTLRVEVDQQHLAAVLGQRRTQVDGGGGLADAALLVAHRDHPGPAVLAHRARLRQVGHRAARRPELHRRAGASTGRSAGSSGRANGSGSEARRRGRDVRGRRRERGTRRHVRGGGSVAHAPIRHCRHSDIVATRRCATDGRPRRPHGPRATPAHRRRPRDPGHGPHARSATRRSPSGSAATSTAARNRQVHSCAGVRVSQNTIGIEGHRTWHSAMPSATTAATALTRPARTFRPPHEPSCGKRKNHR